MSASTRSHKPPLGPEMLVSKDIGTNLPVPDEYNATSTLTVDDISINVLSLLQKRKKPQSSSASVSNVKQLIAKSSKEQQESLNKKIATFPCLNCGVVGMDWMDLFSFFYFFWIVLLPRNSCRSLKKRLYK